ncbi:MAG: phosphatidate cytidylyltransferase [Lentimonas sp.]|jgi:phosphatidate cytidylyltransferase
MIRKMPLSELFKQTSTMKQRVVSFVLLWTIVAIALFAFGIHAGVWLFAGLAYFTQLELYQLFEKMELKPLKKLGSICGPIIIVGAYYLNGIDAGTNVFVLCFILLVFVIIFKDMQAGRLGSFIPTLFGLLYVPYMLHFFIKAAKLAQFNGYGDATGIFLCIWIVVVAKCTDVGGLLIGMKIGKTPLSKISPKKTVEGAIGGIFFSMLVGLLVLGIFNSAAPENFNWWRSLLMALPIGIAAIASDLVESALKRQANVKDSGISIPGIGGIFDLTDSLILTAPLGYLMFAYFIF